MTDSQATPRVHPSPSFAYPSAHSSNPAYLGPRSPWSEHPEATSDIDPLALRRKVLPATTKPAESTAQETDPDDLEDVDVKKEEEEEEEPFYDEEPTEEEEEEEEEEEDYDEEADVTVKQEGESNSDLEVEDEPVPSPPRPPVQYQPFKYDTSHEMDYRPEWERDQLTEEMQGLEDAVEGLSVNYRLVDRLGEGTFSSVYKAIDLKHAQYDNSLWVPSARLSPPPARYTSYKPPKKIYVALKRIYVTSSPARIENEISILEDLRGCPNISQIITAFRYEDQIIAVMPYHCNDDFRTYYRQMSTDNLKCYLRDMFRALRATHARGIIHRDVKPANFLYDSKLQYGVLVDYGLAQRYTPPTAYQPPRCQHTGASIDHPHGKRERNESSAAVEQGIYQSRKRAKLGPDKIGFPADDRRPSVKANRAGTRGFRAPEVLFKCPDQTASIDIWSVGIILLSFLSRKFPIFNSNDDTEALMEISAIFGKARMDKCAAIHNRTFLSNLPSIDHDGHTLEAVILVSNPDLWNHKAFPAPKPLFLDDPFYDPPPGETQHRAEISQALDLLKRCLALDPCKRITATDALLHPWLRRPGIDENKDGPRKPTEGVCRRKHKIDEYGVHSVYAQGGWHEVGYGDAIAMGDEPCPIHAAYNW